MIKERDCIVLKADLADTGLVAGDVGTVVHIHPGKRAFEVEFMTSRGRTITIATLYRTQIRPLSKSEVFHVRELSKA